MGVLDFLKVKKGAPATQAAEMEASLERVRAEMTQATAIIESSRPAPSRHAPERRQ